MAPRSIQIGAAVVLGLVLGCATLGLASFGIEVFEAMVETVTEGAR